VGESYFTWSYSPLLPFSSAPNGVGGVLCTVQETTQKVIGERRILLLRDLAAFGPEAKTADEECRVAAATIARYSKSVPFSLIYLIASREPWRLMSSSTSSFQVASPPLWTESICGPMASQISAQHSRAVCPSAAGCLSPMIGRYASL
jgi:hypothetical protein